MLSNTEAELKESVGCNKKDVYQYTTSHKIELFD